MQPPVHDTDSFLSAMDGYSILVTSLFLGHNLMWILAAFIVCVPIALRLTIPVFGMWGILSFGMVFTGLDVVYHLFRFIGHVYINTCYDHYYKNVKSGTSSLNAHVRSKRFRPYMIKVMLSMSLWTMIWKQFVYASQVTAISPTGTVDLYGRYTAISFVLFYGAVESLWAIQKATWYYLFQKNLGVLTKRIMPLPDAQVLSGDMREVLGQPR